MTELVPIPDPGVPLWFGEAGRPLVVVLHDAYGRLPAIHPFAEALARQGFRVVVPDLYDGFCTIDDVTAASLAGDLDIRFVADTIDALIEDARNDGTLRVGVVGFATGGRLALLHAQGGATDAVVAYYATLRPEEHGVIPEPVLLHFAEADSWEEGADPEEFVTRLKDHGTPVVEHEYLGTRRSFANASIPDRVDTRAAALAFARTATFLQRELDG